MYQAALKKLKKSLEIINKQPHNISKIIYTNNVLVGYSFRHPLSVAHHPFSLLRSMRSCRIRFCIKESSLASHCSNLKLDYRVYNEEQQNYLFFFTQVIVLYDWKRNMTFICSLT